jgi:hypothetical protein
MSNDKVNQFCEPECMDLRNQRIMQVSHKTM